MKKNKSVPLLFVLALAAGLCGGCAAPDLTGSTSRQVRGTLTADETWGGEVIVDDDFLVPAGRTLRIRPGTRIRVRTADTSRTEPEFLDNRTEVLVRGKLVAGGTAENPIFFEPEDPADSREGKNWAGILFDGGEGDLRHCRISGSEFGLLLLSSSPSLQDVRITGVTHGIMDYGPSKASMKNVHVEAEQGGVYLWAGAKPRVAGSLFEADEREGLLVAPGARPSVDGSSFKGPLGGILWAGSPPPPGLPEADLVLGEVSPIPARQDEKRKEAVWVKGGSASPRRDRVYRGENFIGRDETWEGHVVVDGTVMVAPGVLLTIRPGTTVAFSFRDTNGDGIGESEVFVQGRILAAGEKKRPIKFTADGRQGPGRWGAINIMGSDIEENVFSYCLFESSYRGLHSHFSLFRVEHSLFRDNYRALQFQESKAVIRGVDVAGNSSGLRFRDSTVVIEDSRVRGNTWGLQTLRSQVSLLQSVVEDNTLAGIHLRETAGVVGGNRIAGNSPGLRASGGRFRVEDNFFGNNSYGGFQVRDSEVAVTGNRFVGNVGNGVFVNSPAVMLRGNVFKGNLRFALENNSPAAVDAAGNDWGTDRDKVSELIHDSQDDPSLGPVIFDDILIVK